METREQTRRDTTTTTTNSHPKRENSPRLSASSENTKTPEGLEGRIRRKAHTCMASGGGAIPNDEAAATADSATRGPEPLGSAALVGTGVPPVLAGTARLRACANNKHRLIQSGKQEGKSRKLACVHNTHAATHQRARTTQTQPLTSARAQRSRSHTPARACICTYTHKH